jgi:hypothetical protein
LSWSVAQLSPAVHTNRTSPTSRSSPSRTSILVSSSRVANSPIKVGAIAGRALSRPPICDRSGFKVAVTVVTLCRLGGGIGGCGGALRIAAVGRACCPVGHPRPPRGDLERLTAPPAVRQGPTPGRSPRSRFPPQSPSCQSSSPRIAWCSPPRARLRARTAGFGRQASVSAAVRRASATGDEQRRPNARLPQCRTTVRASIRRESRASLPPGRATPAPEPGAGVVRPSGKWSGRQDLNLRPPGPQPGALPDCATPRGLHRFYGSAPVRTTFDGDEWAEDMQDRQVRRGLCKL